VHLDPVGFDDPVRVGEGLVFILRGEDVGAKLVPLLKQNLGGPVLWPERRDAVGIQQDRRTAIQRFRVPVSTSPIRRLMGSSAWKMVLTQMMNAFFPSLTLRA
jgi:hypothetical protein